MKTQIAKASRVIHAPAERVYEIIADYHTRHPLILPKPYFLSLNVEEGGVGEDIIVRFDLRLLGQTRSFRSLITEPEPGRTLLETDINSGVATRFHIRPAGKQLAEVTISTELRRIGLVEGIIARIMLQKVYREELDLLARLAENVDLSSQSISAAAK
jgi:hypothetical protein